MARLTDAIQRGTRAAQPAATAVSAGTLYYVTDESKTERSTGAAWQDCSDAGSAAHNLLSATHSDTTAASVVRGDILIGDATPKWVRLPKGTNGHVLTMGANDPAWSAAAGGGDSTTTAAEASKPAASNDGNLFFPNNGFYVWRDTGATWSPWGPIFPMTAPVDADFAWVNQGTSTVSTTNGGIHLSVPATAGRSFRIRKKAIPAAPYTVTIGFLPLFFPGVDCQMGMVLREAGTSKLVSFGMYVTATTTLDILEQFLTNETTWSSTPSNSPGFHLVRGSGPVWLRIADDSTNRKLSYSVDGQNFLQWRSESRTAHMTPDEIGFFIDVQDATYGAGMTLLSWKQE